MERRVLKWENRCYCDTQEYSFKIEKKGKKHTKPFFIYAETLGKFLKFPLLKVVLELPAPPPPIGFITGFHQLNNWFQTKVISFDCWAPFMRVTTTDEQI